MSKAMAVLTLVILLSACQKPNETSSPSSNQSAPTPPASWRYSSYKDKMSGKDIQLAELNSEEKLNFAFPYNGANQPSLSVRKSPGGAYDVMLQIEKGQFICMLECIVSVKIDQKQPIKIKALPPSDGSTTTIFLKPAPTMIASIKAAKKIIIQSTFYNEGDHALTFNTANFAMK